MLQTPGMVVMDERKERNALNNKDMPSMAVRKVFGERRKGDWRYLGHEGQWERNR